MAKNQIIEYDSTNANNTDVGGIAIQGTSAVENFDNGLREIMTHLKDAVTKRVVKSAGYTALKTDYAQLIEFDGAYTLALTAAATLTDGWMCYVRANGGDVTVDPDGSETINGSSTITVSDGSSALIFCNGTAFFTIGPFPVTSTFGASLIDDATAADARTTLGIPFTAASASGAASFDFAEDTDNGSHRARVQAPASLSADADITLPGATGTLATLTGTETLTNKTLTDPAITGAILEDIYTISDGAAFEVDPSNGSIQLITLGDDRTPKATNFANGESVTLMVDDGTAYTITWTDATWGGSGVVWTGGSAPTLATSGYTVVELWKVGNQVYGAHTGDVA